MNFQQLRIVRETVRQNFNLTDVGNVLYTAQSGVSKHLKDLEDELGVELFLRKGKRLIGLTSPGKELLQIVERILLDTQNLKQVAEHFSKRDEGQLIIATTHTQARYVLPGVVTRFKAEFPKVQLVLHQASPDEIVKQLASGEADIGIATEALDNVPELTSLPYYSWHHTVIVPKGHELTETAPLTLEALSKFPIVTYHEGFTGRACINRSFVHAGIEPDIVMTALDSDVIKAYVELGLGIGITASVAFNPDRDHSLEAIHAEHLFEANTTRLAIRTGHYLRAFAYRFIELCSPELALPAVKARLENG